MADRTPDYLTENADNSVTVSLIRGVDADGVTLMSVTLREPTVDDLKAAQTVGKGNSANAETALIANLAGLDPATLGAMKLRDYARVQAALGFFEL